MTHFRTPACGYLKVAEQTLCTACRSLPVPIRMANQARVVVARIARDFRPDPVGLNECGILCRQLDLRYDEPFIRAGKASTSQV